MNVIIVVAIFVLIVGFIIGSYIRRRMMVFEGTVIDKDIHETEVVQQNNTAGTIQLGNRTGLKYSYMIKVQTTAGKTITWQLSHGKYEIVKIGDYVTKPKGTTDITITPQVPQTPVPPASPAPLSQ